MPELQIKFTTDYLQQAKLGIGELRQELNKKLLNVLESPESVRNVTLMPNGLLKVHDIVIEKGLVSIRGKTICALAAMQRVARSLGGTVQ